MKKFDRDEAIRFWEVHDEEWAKSDRSGDPDALQNVVYPGQPLWFGRRWLANMEEAYKALFDLVPPPEPGERALDVGCGAGRWTTFLDGHGYRAVGIDIQRKLIEENRRRYPDIEFRCETVQDYSPGEKFSLVSSSTVIQHSPLDEQLMVVGKIRRLLEDGGHVIMLESVRDTPDPYTFPRKIEGWKSLFEEAGFTTVETRRYHYNPFSRIGGRLLSLAKGDSKKMSFSTEGASLEEQARILEPKKKPVAVDLAKRLLVGMDGGAEAMLFGLNAPLSSRHCAFLFRAV